MIFVTVGSELSFDRLSRAVDEWCAYHPEIEVYGQIGEPGENGFLPKNFTWKSFVSPEEYKNRCSEATLIVAHAGMGSIITALTLGTPILIMPRRVAFGETRNDHQVDTAKRFSERGGILAAEDETQVSVILDRWSEDPAAITVEEATPYADERLIEAIKHFIWS